MKSPDHILFLHIPKTAGSTLHTVIQRNYGKHDFFTTNAIRYPNEITQLDDDRRKKLLGVKGHIPFGYHENLDPGTFEYFTILREPVSRVVSHYNQVIRSTKHHFYEEWAKNRYTLEQLMENGKLIYLDNLMVRMISGKLNVPWNSLSDDDLQLALKNIDGHFSLVGIQEQFNEFLLLLCEHYGWKWPYYRKQQVATQEQKKATLDEKTLSLVRKHNQLDIMLYNEIKLRFEKLVAVQDEKFHTKLQRFNRVNSRIERILNLIPFIPPPRA